MLKSLHKFIAFSGENGGKFRWAIVIGVFQAIFEAMRIPAVYLVLSGVLAGELTGKTILLGFLIMLLSVVGDGIFRAVGTIFQTEGGYRTAAGKRMEIAEHLRYLPMGYFNKNSLGYITSVTTNTMEDLGDLATRVVMMTTSGLLNSAIIALVMLIFDWRIGLVAIAGYLLFLLVNRWIRKVTTHFAEEKMVVDSVLVEKVLEYLHGNAELRAYHAGSRMRKDLDAANEATAILNTDAEITYNRYCILQSLIVKLVGVAISVASIIFYFQGTLSLLYAIVLIISSFMLFATLESAGNFSGLLSVVDRNVDKANAILDLPPMDLQGKGAKAGSSNLTTEEITFSYDERPIISGISVTIPEKTTTAIVGPSGSGKTTLCKLLARFWDVDTGKVTLDGKDVRDYSMNDLMQNYSFVFQNVYLFHDTIANNIRFGNPDAPMADVVEAAKSACCHEFISALPDGYDTVIGEGGASISGGEKQRLSIARAMMKDAPVVILDEATANVDPENERDLMEAIRALTREKTILMIAHRLKTVRHADQILVVDQGKIVEQGTHEELLAQNGLYKSFLIDREEAVSWKI